MLRESAIATNRPLDVRAVSDPTVDPLLRGGPALVALVDAAVAGEAHGIVAAGRSVTAALGSAALADAAAVIGNFEMMNRVAQGTGIPVGRGARLANAELVATLGLDSFDHPDAG